MAAMVETKIDAEDPWLYLPKSRKQLAQIPERVKEIFHLHLQCLRQEHKYIPQNTSRPIDIEGLRYDVKKEISGEGEKFSFYCEPGAGQGETIILTIDKDLGRIKRAEILKKNLRTTIDLRGGVFLEQVITPGQSSQEQKFILDTKSANLAKLTWITDREEKDIITVGKTEVIISAQQVKWNLNNQELFIQIPQGALLRFSALSSPDDFVSEAIEKVLRLEPVLNFAASEESF